MGGAQAEELGRMVLHRLPVCCGLMVIGWGQWRRRVCDMSVAIGASHACSMAFHEYCVMNVVLAELACTSLIFMCL